MIKILPIKKQSPYFKVTLYYIIGDADGNTTETLIYKTEKELKKDIPYIKLLQKIKPLEGHWGIVFSNYPNEYPGEYIGLTKEEYSKFMDLLDYEATPSVCISDSLYSEREHYWVSFQDIDVVYVDENGGIHEVIID